MPTTVRLAWCALKAGTPAGSQRPHRREVVVVRLTRQRPEPEIMDAGHTVCQRGSRQQIFDPSLGLDCALATLRDRSCSTVYGQ